MIYTLIQTAIESKAYLFRYLTWLMDSAANMYLNRPESIQQLLPWNALENCTVNCRYEARAWICTPDVGLFVRHTILEFTLPAPGVKASKRSAVVQFHHIWTRIPPPL